MTQEANFACTGPCPTINRLVADGLNETAMRQLCQQNRTEASTDPKFSLMTTIQLGRVCAVVFNGEPILEGAQHA